MTLSQVAVPGVGATAEFNGYLKGIITGITTTVFASTTNTTGNTLVDVKVVSRVATGETAPGPGFATERALDYAKGDSAKTFNTTTAVSFINSALGVATGRFGGVAGASATPTSSVDWYEQQKIGTTNSNIFWKEIALDPKQLCLLPRRTQDLMKFTSQLLMMRER